MLVILEIEPALVGGRPPVFIDEIGARIDQPLGLRHLDAFEAVLDGQPLGEAEFIAGRLRCGGGVVAPGPALWRWSKKLAS